MHCGNPQCGAANPNFKNKGFSKHLPPKIRERYEEAVNDPNILSSMTEIGILSARQIELSERLYGGESGGLLKAIRDAWEEFQDANRQGDQAKLTEAAINLGTAISQGAAHEQQWRELRDVQRDLTKTKEVEWKRMNDLKQLVAVDQVIVLVGHIIQSIHKHVNVASLGVQARPVLDAITTEIARVIDVPERDDV